MSRWTGHTSRQIVMAGMMSELAGLYNEVKNHSTFMGEGLPPIQRRDVLRHIALQHNSLLAGSGLDGVDLEIPAKDFAGA